MGGGKLELRPETPCLLAGAAKPTLWNNVMKRLSGNLWGFLAAMFVSATATTADSQTPANMALIPAGSFQMGDTFNEGGSGELPVHSVYVGAFYMDRYEVTKALWDEVKAWNGGNAYGYDNPGSGKATNHPVHSVNWFDMVKWCNARSEKDGRVPVYYTDAAFTQVYKTGQVTPYPNWLANGYRLPTEAEWEKAARGGANGHRFPWSDADTINQSRANYDSYWLNGVPFYSYDVNSTSGNHPAFSTGAAPYTSPVGYFAPNGYGLYDMAGNVWERCWDWHGAYSSGFQINPSGAISGSHRVQRGGSSGSGADCRTALRGDSNPADGYFTIGFRSVLSETASPGIGVTVTTAKAGDNLWLLWPNPGAAYRVESALSLSPPVLWGSEAGSLQTNGGTVSLVVPLSGSQRFFRLAKP